MFCSLNSRISPVSLRRKKNKTNKAMCNADSFPSYHYLSGTYCADTLTICSVQILIVVAFFYKHMLLPHIYRWFVTKSCHLINFKQTTFACRLKLLFKTNFLVGTNEKQKRFLAVIIVYVYILILGSPLLYFHFLYCVVTMKAFLLFRFGETIEA